MHINDVYALRDVLSTIQAGDRAEPVIVQALLEAANQEVEAFEKRIYQLAEREEAQQD